MKASTELRDPHLAIMIIGVVVAIYFLTSPNMGNYISSLNSFGYIGALFSGFFFSSMLTTIPATVSLFLLGSTNNPLIVAVLGALGAMAADFIIFSLMKHKLSHHYGIFQKIKMWIGERKFAIWISHHRVFKYSIPLLGAMIIASPLPDELGIAILGASKYENKKFFALTFVMNLLGILAIVSFNKIIYS